MNKNFIRIIIGALLGIALLTVFMILLETNALLWAAYVWSVWAVIVFAIGIGYWSTGDKTKYLLFAAYALILKNYLIATLLVSVVATVLDRLQICSIRWGWFTLIEFVILAIAAWKLQALDAGKDAILTTEQAVKLNTANWKALVSDITAIAERTPPASKKNVEHAMETIRFADPSEHPAVVDIEAELGRSVCELGKMVDSSEVEKIAELCLKIEHLVKVRANKLLIVK